MTTKTKKAPAPKSTNEPARAAAAKKLKEAGVNADAMMYPYLLQLMADHPQWHIDRAKFAAVRLKPFLNLILIADQENMTFTIRAKPFWSDFSQEWQTMHTAKDYRTWKVHAKTPEAVSKAITKWLATNGEICEQTTQRCHGQYKAKDNESRLTYERALAEARIPIRLDSPPRPIISHGYVNRGGRSEWVKTIIGNVGQVKLEIPTPARSDGTIRMTIEIHSGDPRDNTTVPQAVADALKILVEVTELAKRSAPTTAEEILMTASLRAAYYADQEEKRHATE